MSDSSEKILDNKKLNKKSDFLQEIESSNEKCIYMNNNTSIFSPDSPLLCVDDFQHNSFLNSFVSMFLLFNYNFWSILNYNTNHIIL